MATRYPPEFKIKAIQYFLAGHAGLGLTARHFGISRTNLRRWIELYRFHGVQAILPRHNPSYSPEFKLRVAIYATLHPGSSARIASRFGLVSHKSVESWTEAFRLKGHQAFVFPATERNASMTKSAPKKLPADAATHEALLKELEYLRAENDYLKTLQEILTEKKRQEQVKKQQQ